MKIKEGFNLRRVGDENVIVAQGVQNVDFTKIISLNDTAAYLWREAEGIDFSVETLTEQIVRHYDIDALTAQKDVAELVQAWLDAGIVSE